MAMSSQRWGMSGNSVVPYFEDDDLAVLAFCTRMEERLLVDKFQYYVDYPADQLSDTIISNIFTGNYDKMPSPELPLWLDIM